MRRAAAPAIVLAACAAEAGDVLVVEEAVAPGAECESGGVRVSAGIDDDGSGTLEVEEIDDVTVVCHEGSTLEGDLVVRNDDDARRLRGVSVITGSLTIAAPNLDVIDLSLLVRVDGAFESTGFGGPLRAPALRSVGGAFTAVGTEVIAPQLATVGGRARLSVASCGPLDVSALASVAGDLDVTCLVFVMFGGGSYHFPSLATVDGGLIAYGGFDLDAPLVTRLDFLHVLPRPPIIENGFNRVRSIAMPALTTIDAALDIQWSEIRTLSLPALASVGQITIRNNTMLCESVATELATRTGAPSDIGGNASCAQ